MKLVTRYIVDHVTIASKHHDTGEIVVSKKVEELKGVKFNEAKFVEAIDGSKVRVEPDTDGGIIKINYMYYKPELIEVDLQNSFGGNYIYFRNQSKAIESGYVKCNNCGKWHRKYARLTYNVPNTTGDSIRLFKYFCSERCASEKGFHICTECGKLKPISELSPYYDQRDGSVRNVCNNCREHSFFTCQRCGGSFSRRESFFSRNGSVCYCCYDQVREEEKEYDIDDYHTAKNNNRWKFYKTSDDLESVDYIGTELEVESKGCCASDVAFEARKLLNRTSAGILAHLEHDGSLNDGVEIIFNPMTLNYMYSQEKLLKNAFDKLATVASSHDTSTCGLHIHYSRGKFNNEDIIRLVYLFEKYRVQLETLARRKNNHYAKFYGWSDLNIDYVSRNIDYNSDRYRAVNLRNSDTIEIRIFKGTLKFSTYMASIELVNNFMQAALEFTNEEVEQLSFEEIIKLLPTKYLIPYCIEKHLLDEEKVEIVEYEKPTTENATDVELVRNIQPYDLGGGDYECVLPF